jgi:hypothetical protein
LKDDPYEMNNLLGSNPDKKKYTLKVNELHSDLANWLKQHYSVNYEGVKNRNLTGIPLSTGSIDQPEKQFRIFPNPADGRFNLKVNESGEYRMMVYNSSGSLLIDRKSDKISEIIDLAGYSAGLYTLRIVSGEIVSSTKLVNNKMAK